MLKRHFSRSVHHIIGSAGAECMNLGRLETLVRHFRQGRQLLWYPVYLSARQPNPVWKDVKGSKLFPYRVDPFQKGANNFDRVVSLESVSVPLPLSAPNFRRHLSSAFFFFFLILTNYRLERRLYVKLKDWMSNSIDPDETVHSGSMLFAKVPIIIAYDSERVKYHKYKDLHYLAPGLLYIWKQMQSNSPKRKFVFSALYLK